MRDQEDTSNSSLCVGEEILKRLLNSDEIDVVREACRAIQNLLTIVLRHRALILAGVVPRIVHLAANSSDFETAYSAMVAIRKLSPNSAAHQALLAANVLPTVFDAAMGASRFQGTEHIASRREDKGMEESRSDDEEEKGRRTLLKSGSADLKMQLRAAEVLRDLAGNSACQVEFVRSGGVSVLLKVLRGVSDF